MANEHTWQSAMINLYKADKYMCTKHIAAMDGISITYSDKSCEGRKRAAESRYKHWLKKLEDDPNAVHGPPDCQSHFKQVSSTKMYYIIKLKFVLIIACHMLSCC